MPQMADITIKKNDGTTDIVYTGTVPASGSEPAVWRATAGVAAPALAPEFRLSARDADNGKKRALRSTFVFPQSVTNTTTGVTTVSDRALGSTDVSFSKNMSQSAIDEFVAQWSGLLRAALIQSCLKAGYSAT